MSASTVALRLLDGAPDNPSPTSPIFKFSGTPRHARQLSGHSSPSIASECPPSLPFLDFVRSWNDSHIARWLAESKCGSHSSLFQDNDIRGDIILDLDQHALKEMGIVSVGDRIKILSAVKSLRQKCARTLSFTVNGLSTRVGSGTPLRLTESPVQAPTESSTLTRTLSLGSSTGRRLDGGRPPPLHLAQVSTRDLPQIVGNSANPPSARFLATPGRKGPQPSPGPPSSQIPTHAPNSALPVTPASHHRSPQSRLATPAQPNKPISRGQSTPNLTTPTTSLPGRRTPVQSEHPPPAFTNEPLPPAPASNSSWQGEYGLPRGPSPGNLQGGTFASDNRRNMRSPSPLQSGGQRPAIVTHRAPAHQKSGSTSSLSPVNGTLPFTSKPSAGTGTTPHPYASGALQPSSAIAVNLSPIAEMFTPKDNNLTPGYSVGRGPFSNSNRPTTPSHPVPMSLEILRRMCVKFILPDDGHTRMINVGDCEGGVEVLERALKKMNKTRGGAGPAETGETEDGGLIVDGWAVYLEGPGTEGTSMSKLTRCLMSR
jgi:mitogen-activated protein kinase kinase kinase